MKSKKEKEGVRGYLNISQYQLADMLGESREAVARVERSGSIRGSKLSRKMTEMEIDVYTAGKAISMDATLAHINQEGEIKQFCEEQLVKCAIERKKLDLKLAEMEHEYELNLPAVHRIAAYLKLHADKLTPTIEKQLIAFQAIAENRIYDKGPLAQLPLKLKKVQLIAKIEELEKVLNQLR